MKPKRKRSKLTSPSMKRKSLEIEEFNFDGTFPTQEKADEND